MRKYVLYVLVCVLIVGLLTAWVVGAESPNTGTEKAAS